ncbi:hypothetical protein [Streptomyces sp. NPDC049915]|uniref:hypothetical protein n=1 Tax=Streptomyces sp. NPDC049915 TaxID=3155510 RepID=UPI003445B7E1
MGLRTVVSIAAWNDALEEARQALWSLVTGPFGLVEVSRSSAPDATTTVVASLPGDVRGEVEERLSGLTALPYVVELTDDAGLVDDDV